MNALLRLEINALGDVRLSAITMATYVCEEGEAAAGASTVIIAACCSGLITLL